MKDWNTQVRKNRFLSVVEFFGAALFIVQSKEEQGEESQIDGDIAGVFVGIWKDVSRMRQTGCRMHLSEKSSGTCR